MMSQISHTEQLHKLIAQLNHMKQVMNGMTLHTRLKIHGSQEFVKIPLTGRGNYA